MNHVVKCLRRIGIPVEWVRNPKHVHIVGHIGCGKSNYLMRGLMSMLMPARNESDH